MYVNQPSTLIRIASVAFEFGTRRTLAAARLEAGLRSQVGPLDLDCPLKLCGCIVGTTRLGVCPAVADHHDGVGRVQGEYVAIGALGGFVGSAAVSRERQSTECRIVGGRHSEHIGTHLLHKGPLAPRDEGKRESEPGLDGRRCGISGGSPSPDLRSCLGGFRGRFAARTAPSS